MAAVAVGVAGAAALAYGISQLTKAPFESQKRSLDRSWAPYAYEAKVDPRETDPYELKHTIWEGRTESAGWEDMEWQLDCGQNGPGGCVGVRTPGDGNTPFAAPVWGEVQDRTVRPLGTREPDSFLEESVYRNAQRDASTRYETPPERNGRTRYATHPLDWGGQLQPDEIPYGAQEATDLQFWGAENWDSYRHSKRPAYLDNATNQKDGKQINRPLDDFGSSMWDTERKAVGSSRDWGIGAGEFTARDATPRLLAMNQYGSNVSTTKFERPLLLPPTPAGAPGGGNPNTEAEVTLGARLNRMFSAFQPWKSSGAGTRAPPEYADQYMNKSRVLLHEARTEVAAAGSGQRAYGGMGVNPYEGYHYASRETNEGPAIGRSSRAGNGYLLLGPCEEYRPRKVPSDLEEYIAPRGGSSTSTYGGEAAHGVSIPNLKSNAALEIKPTVGGGGAVGGGLLGKVGIVTLKHNTAVGTRGGDYDDSPIPEQLINLTTPRSVALQVGGRSKRALDDLFDVLIS